MRFVAVLERLLCVAIANLRYVSQEALICYSSLCLLDLISMFESK